MNGKTKGKQSHRPVVVMTYDDYEDIREGMNRRAKTRRSADRANLAKYYGRQRFFGLAILLIGVVCLVVGCSIEAKMLEYFGFAIGLFGLYIAFTKNMVLVDQYYLERQDRLNEF